MHQFVLFVVVFVFGFVYVSVQFGATRNGRAANFWGKLIVRALDAVSEFGDFRKFPQFSPV